MMMLKCHGVAAAPTLTFDWLAPPSSPLQKKKIKINYRKEKKKKEF